MSEYARSSGTPCECSGPGWCERHQMVKTPHWHQLCQTRDNYRAAWDAGQGPGQLPPGSSPPRAASPPGVGTELRRALGCCNFPYAKRLNDWGPAECLERIDEIVAMLLEHSCKSKESLSDHAARRLVHLAVERVKTASG